MSEHDAAAARGAGKWTRKEILGHLIDSAANNHQRFVRARVENPYTGPGYNQTEWVAANAYEQREWLELVELWCVLNGHLAYVMQGVPAELLQTRCTIGNGPPVTLEWLMRDYLVHMRHHLAQIFE